MTLNVIRAGMRHTFVVAQAEGNAPNYCVRYDMDDRYVVEMSTIRPETGEHPLDTYFRAVREMSDMYHKRMRTITAEELAMPPLTGRTVGGA